MRKATRAALATAAIAVLAFGGGAAASAAPAIPVNNGQETTGAEGGAHGFFSYTIDGDEFCYTLEVEGLTAPAVAAHIHVAPRKVAGPIVVPLIVPNATTFDISGCTTADPAVLAAIAANPRDYYVNVHTPTYPGGEVRGQLK
ncbi:CHRD domain-containing protein [Microbacterium cremeum]|uniref:CHRD domain-containing protein n=1 Tax=Microbacterium cremeum TaxID=2782169 RepID=UPI001887D6DB|nr:CHRD domain-containing protein [Microbacterium cremeum]